MSSTHPFVHSFIHMQCLLERAVAELPGLLGALHHRAVLYGALGGLLHSGRFAKTAEIHLQSGEC